MGKVKLAGVVGASTLGSGIAITIARGGFKTIVHDMNQAVLDRAHALTLGFFRKSVEKKKMTEEQMHEAIDRMTFTTSQQAMADCDFIVEAIFENVVTKQKLFADLDQICAPHTIFASNTSTLLITELASKSGRPDRVVGMHYCLPAQVMKLIEMSRGMLTSDETWAAAWEFAHATKQIPIETPDKPGFILNHFLIPFNNDVIRLIDAGVAKPADIDRAIKTGMGYSMGPCELLDHVGLDTQLRVCDAFFDITNNPRVKPPALLRKMVAANLLGRKTGEGFFKYKTDAMFGG